MHIPPSTLIIVLFSYLLLLLSADWLQQLSGAWYRPFLIGLAIIIMAAWAYREQHGDDV